MKLDNYSIGSSLIIDNNEYEINEILISKENLSIQAIKKTKHKKNSIVGFHSKK